MAAAFCLAAQFVNAQAPTESAPVPTYPEEDVLAIYSVAYTSPLTELKFQDDWYTKGETTTVADVEVGDDAAMKITDLQWASFKMKPEIKFRGYDYLHVDVYSNEDAEFCIGFQNWVPGEEVYSKVVNVAAGKWNSYDFPLSDIFVTNEARNANVLRINKYITDVDPGTKFAKEIYVSNIYVYKGEPASIVRSANSSAEEVAIYPATVKDYLHVDAGQNVDAVKLYSVSGSLVLSSGAGINQINVSSLPKGVYIVTVTLADGSVTNKKIMKQ